MTDITFEPSDERALAFIDTEDIIKPLEGLGYQVIDKSEHCGEALEGKFQEFINKLEEMPIDEFMNICGKYNFGEAVKTNS